LNDEIENNKTFIKKPRKKKKKSNNKDQIGIER
jgi:hypothetical protein